jgi:hypothetical protein
MQALMQDLDWCTIFTKIAFLPSLLKPRQCSVTHYYTAYICIDCSGPFPLTSFSLQRVLCEKLSVSMIRKSESGFCPYFSAVHRIPFVFSRTSAGGFRPGLGAQLGRSSFRTVICGSEANYPDVDK